MKESQFDSKHITTFNMVCMSTIPTVVVRCQQTWVVELALSGKWLWLSGEFSPRHSSTASDEPDKVQHCSVSLDTHTHTHTHTFNGLFSRIIWVSRHQKGKPFWILLKQEMMGWKWHQLDHMQIICTTLQTDNHDSTPLLNFLWAGCSSWCPTNSVKALKEQHSTQHVFYAGR